MKWDRMQVWTRKPSRKLSPGLHKVWDPVSWEKHPRLEKGVGIDIYKRLLHFRSLPLGLWAPLPSLLSIAPCLEQVSFKMKFLNNTRIPLNNGILELKGTT